jgi:hypothetical protein
MHWIDAVRAQPYAVAILTLFVFADAAVAAF